MRLSFFFNDPSTTEIYTLSLHDALPISTSTQTTVTSTGPPFACTASRTATGSRASTTRSEEHTSELQSQSNLVCRLLLEKKKTHPATGSCARGTGASCGHAPPVASAIAT